VFHKANKLVTKRFHRYDRSSLVIAVLAISEGLL
jgi:hypothetical protein